MGDKLLGICCLFAALAHAQTAEPADAAGIEFFEAKIRPVLAKNCYGCHSAATKVISAGLQLDNRDGMRKGGISGPAIIPGRSNKSLLIRAIHYQGKKMPPSGQLPEAVIADFEHWVDMGAPDPRAGKTPDWKPVPLDLTKARASWIFQPPRTPAIPAVRNEKWPLQPMDRFILARLEEKQLTPVGRCGSRHLAAAGDFRSDRPSAGATETRRVRQRSRGGRLREGRRPAARLARVRRALGPALARRRPLCRVRRTQPQLHVPVRLALSRLRHRLVQQGQAVRPVRPRADRRRPASRLQRRAAQRAD